MSLLIPGTNSIKDTGYNVANSARFNSGSTEYLQRTYGTPTNAKIFGLSWWIKMSGDPVAGTGQFDQWGERTNSSNRVFMSIDGVGQFDFFEKNGGSNVLELETTRLFRDNGAWYHFLLLGDSTQSTASNRIKLYVNGVQETSFVTETYPSQDYEFRLALNSTKYFGRIGLGSQLSTNYFDGYLAEVAFVDGTVTAHTDYGEFDSDSPTIWKPKDVSGLTFGNNVFYLDFEDSSALGNDVSGNDNDFTVNNLTSVDQSTDTCTNNFATMNPSDNYYASATFTEGNLKVQTATSPTTFVRSTIGITANFKCYWEAKFDTTQSGNGEIGIVDIGAPGSTGGSSRLYYQRNGISVNDLGQVWANNSNSGQSLGTLSTSDIIGFAWDGPNSALYVRKNGEAWLNSGDPTSGSSKTGAFTTQDSGIEMFPAVGDQNGSGGMTASLNFGSAPYSISSGNQDADGFGNFEYAVPSGYFALCTKNLAENG